MLNALHELKAVGSGLTNSSAVSGSSIVSGSAEGAKVTGNPFRDLFTDTVGRVDQLEGQARAAVDGFITGKGVDVHQVMIAAEKASMAFELALAVRNKAVQSYQSVMSMQF
jgi:flagellar hook-basal body complex protein FliE